MKVTFWHGLGVGVIAILLLAFLTDQAAAQDMPPLIFEWQHFEDTKLLDGEPWSPDNRYLAVSSMENDAILLFARETWEVARRLELPTTESEISTLQWSADRRYIAVSSWKDLIVVDVPDDSAAVLTNLLSPGRLDTRWMGEDTLAVLSAVWLNGDEVTITLIDVPSQEIIRQFELYDYEFRSIFATFEWNLHSKLFATPLGTTFTIGFWDEFGNLSSELVRQDVQYPYLSASQCGTTNSLEPSPTPEFNFHGMGGNEVLLDMQWSNDGRRLAFTNYGWAVVCILNSELDAVESVRLVGIPNPAYYPDNDVIGLSPHKMPNEVSWSPDDRWLLVSQFYVPPGMSEDSCGIAVFDAAQDFAYAGEMGEEFCQVSSMNWSPDGGQLAIGNGSDGFWVGTLQ